MAGIWLTLGAVVSFLVGRGGRRVTPTPKRVVAVTEPVRTFTTLTSLDWVLEANRVATADLLSTNPGAIRQVPAR